MIRCNLEAMNAVQNEAFRTWLAKGEMHHLIQVAEAQVKHWECKALEDAIASKDYEKKMESANESLRKAQKYATFLEVLKQFTDQKEPHMLAKIS